jgi:hypothetical protein
VRIGRAGWALSLVLSATPAGASPLARGDAAWERRAAGQLEGRARPEPVREAIAAYEAAVAERPEDLEARWKLVRALWFQGEFASRTEAEERAAYQRARGIAEPLASRLSERLGNPAPEEASARPAALRARLPERELRDAAHLYFWGAVGLGAWSRSAGLLEAVRAGAARRLHEYTVLSIALDPGVEGGGAIRLLSRLHAELPRVPLLSGFVERGRALPLAERALAEYPEHPGNAYLFGLTLLELAPERRDEALRLVRAAARLEPRPEQHVEDTAMRMDARSRLEAESRLERARQEDSDADPRQRDRAA